MLSWQSLALISALACSVQAGMKSMPDTTPYYTTSYIKQQREKLKDRQIYAHLISHTHDDVGWLKTVDEYYSGTQDSVAHANVKLILDTVIDELWIDPSKKFTYVEMKFFSMWWLEQTEDKKAQVRQLVNEGRFEFVNAGWSMHDEACTHYEDIINNMAYGHEFLLREFGIKPRIGWHVDPFGHSNANPRLFADMGFDAWFFARLDNDDKQQRVPDRSMEFVWRPFYQHLGNSTQIFTHAMFSHYCWPDDLWYDDRWTSDDPVVIDPNMETFNGDDKVNQLLGRIYDMLDTYRGDHLLITMGCDFSFANARMNFMSMDRLISYFNAHVSNVTLFYSTPGMYLDALKSQNESYPLKYDDMFPYSNVGNDYWTGYYTSRPNSKKQVRDGQANLHASNKIFALRTLDQHTTNEEIVEILEANDDLLDSMGVYQHHDGISGTAKQHVADDYIYQVYKAIKKSNPVYAKVMNELISYYSNVQSTEWLWCERFNGTYLDCPISSNLNKTHIVAVHNPTVYDQNYIKLKVSHGNYNVTVWDTETLAFKNVTSAAVICVDRYVESSALVHDCDLHIKQITPPSAFTIFQLTYDLTINLTVKEDTGSIHLISGLNETLNYTGTDENGVRFDLIKNESQKTYKIAFDLRFYQSYQGGGNISEVPSGAYSFILPHENQSSFVYASLKEIKSFNGSFVQEIFMNFTNEDDSQKAYVKLRYYDNSVSSEWEVYMGEIPGTPHEDPQGREVTINWKSFDINNNNTFYTDSNGLEMQKRILNQRPSFNFSSDQKTPSNYYPVNSAIAIIDEEAQLQMTVMNDRSQGGSVIEQGRIELMQNRRLYHDDDKGVEEPLDETDEFGMGISVPATYRLEFIERNRSISHQRSIQLFVDEPLQFFFAFNWNTTTKLTQSLAQPQQGLQLKAPSIPPAFKYVLFPLERNKIQVRLENIGDRFDTDHWNLTSNDTTINFPLDYLCQKLFDDANHQNPMIKLVNITYVETSLTGNQQYSDVISSKTNWQVISTDDQPMGRTLQNPNQDFNSIDLSQQRIRMFNVTFTANVTTEAEQLIFLS